MEKRKNKTNRRTALTVLILAICLISMSVLPAYAAEVNQNSDTDSNTLSSEVESTSSTEGLSDIFTVTYDLGSYGIFTEQVALNQKPTQIPDTNYTGSTFSGWYNEAGEVVDPSTIPVTANITYKGKFSRNVEDLLDTVNHESYMSGYPNGMFKPESAITRAETAQIFYSLLLDKGWGIKEFSDVPSSAWYYSAVSTLAKLGVVSGYENGKFLPGNNITRAEFVTIAVGFSQIDESATVSFSDVKKGAWNYGAIATAYSKGWISGYNDGTFKPDAKITRAEAVAIVNKILDRNPPSDITTKINVTNFYDVFNDHWAYGHIAEATTSHYYTKDNNTEVWTYYTTDPTVETSHWVIDGSDKYYVSSATRKFVTGEQTIDGKKYYFGSDGKAFTGFRYVGHWKRYYKNGEMLDDISTLGLVSGPYQIKVYKNSNYVIVYAKDGSNGYTIPVKAMIASCGKDTPTGTFYTPAKYRWKALIGPSWGQWSTRIKDGFLFHTVPSYNQNNNSMKVDYYNQLGTTRSMGCVRLQAVDAKWIYDNCSLGTAVVITASENSGPLSKPTIDKLPSWHTWDPTDPTAQYLCQKSGCKH